MGVYTSAAALAAGWTSRKRRGSRLWPFGQNPSRRLVPIGVAVVVSMVGALAACSPPNAQDGGSKSAGFGKTTIGSPFRLTDQDGKPADESLLKGRWTVMFFGYTFCPDACPATLTTLGAAIDQLGPKAEKLHTVLISIDPARDTPEQLKTYISSPVFPEAMTALTGTPEQVAAMAKNYGAYFAKNGEGSDYLMDHSTALYLFNPKGDFIELVRPDMPPAEVAAAIAKAMDRG